MPSYFIRGLIKKSMTFGAILTGADATVQIIQRQAKLRQFEFNWKSLQRHGLVGSCVIGPLLYSWYYVLDKGLPGASTRTVLLKVACDCICANLAYYCAFYYSISFLQHKNHERAKEDTKNKVAKTYVIGMLYWGPLMAINFKYLSPQSRVIFVAIATYIEMNGLCIVSRGSGRKEKEKGLLVEKEKGLLVPVVP
jgi:hypothetical protein